MVKFYFMGLSQIDFQLSVYATPAIDLTYLLYMVSDNDARDNRDELLKTYHDQFTATLKSLGHLGAIPSLSDFHVELQRNGIVGKWEVGDGERSSVCVRDGSIIH